MGAAVAGGAGELISRGVSRYAGGIRDNSMFAGANYRGNSVYGRQAAAAEGGRLGRRLGRWVIALKVVSRVSGAVGIVTTGISAIGHADCYRRCKDPCEDMSNRL